MKPVTIAIDACGGYAGVTPLVESVAALSRQFAKQSNVFFTLVGPEKEVHDALAGYSHNVERISVINADVSIPLDAYEDEWAERTDTSIRLACDWVEQGEAQAVVSCGNPGLTVDVVSRTFGLLDGVSQSALVAVYPTSRPRTADRDRLSMLLDVGAHPRATAEQLLTYALMGSAYATMLTGLNDPKVALLSNSQEKLGPEQVRRAIPLLEAHQHVNFCGTTEGFRIPFGEFDVVVCEGFVGDVVIKLIDGAGDAMFEVAQTAYESKFAWRMGLRLLSEGLEKIRSILDIDEYGGAPLLGIDEVFIHAHPNSAAPALTNAIKLAVKCVRNNLSDRVQSAVSIGAGS